MADLTIYDDADLDPPIAGWLPSVARVASNLRQIFSLFLPLWSAFFVHSCAVLLGEVSVLFLGPNGGGKSTVARLADGLSVLDDDHILVKREDRGFVAYSTPLGAGVRSPMAGRIGAMFLLEKGSSFSLAPVSPADVLQLVWHDNASTTMLLPRALKSAVFGLFLDLCYGVPLRRMTFMPHSIHWDQIRSVVA
ncbi:hypothetical protein JXA88_15045 [Candidatus Fermentibacteria bacterium]|nr:hypothetical protein [Candidatus Fermentibacteria bacterium]